MAPIIRCSFCDRTRPESEEDFIPIWAGKVLRSIHGPKLDIVYSIRQIDIDEKTVIQHAHERRQTYSAIKLRGVCKTCNNGWMSQIEQAAKPILEPMMRDHRHGISVRCQAPLATWVALKTLEADLIPHGYPTASTGDFHAFFAAPKPPDMFRADLGRIDLGGKADLYYQISPTFAGQALGGMSVGDPLAVEFSLSLGAVWIQSVYRNVASKDYPHLPVRETSPFWATVWPQDRDVDWPPPYSFTESQLPQSLAEFPEAEDWIDKNVRKKKEENEEGGEKD